MENGVYFHQIGKDEMYKVWHTSGNHEIIYMHSDGGSVVFQDTIYPIKNGAMFFIGAYKNHYTLPDNPALYNRSKLFMPPDVNWEVLCQVLELNKNLFSEHGVVYAQIPPNEQNIVEKIFSLAIEFTEKSAVFGCFIQLLSYLEKYKTETIPDNENFIAKVMGYISNHLSENINIDILCNTACMSKYYFCRQFKKITGHTVMNYILITRIAMATTLLTTTNFTVGQISEKCGFSDCAYFCHAFKRYIGETPLGYRKMYQ